MKMITTLLATMTCLIGAANINASSFPACPTAGAANQAVHQLTSVSAGIPPSGWLLYHSAVVSTPGYDSQYNYYATQLPSGKTPLAQMNYLAMFFTPPQTVTYTENKIDYQQCVYYGAMSAGPNGTYLPTGTQVLTLQFSHAATPPPPPVPVPLTVHTTQALPGVTVEGRSYVVTYTLTNPNAKAVNYTLTQPGAADVTFTTPSANACNVDDQQSSLASNTSCNISLEFNDSKLENYQQDVLMLSSELGVTPAKLSLTTSVQKILAKNVIIFGDSLTDICSPGPFTNKDPLLGKRVWPQDFLAETAVYAQGLNCWKNSGVDIVQQNVDYAIGGARITGGNTAIDIPAQIASYDAALAKYKSPDGKRVYPDLNTKFIFWIAGNDLLAYDPNTPDSKAKQDMTTIANQLMGMIQNFASSNHIPAHNIYIINLPNIAAASGHQVLAFTKFVNWYNTALNDAVSKFVDPQSYKPIVIDSYGPGMKLFLYVAGGSINPASPYAKYGFSKALMMKACNQYEKGPSQACKGYLSWDGTHPDVMLHQFFADSFASYVDPKLTTVEK